MKTITTFGLVALLALTLGVCTGCGDDDPEPRSAKKRGGGPQGPTPSEAAENVPNGTWSKVDCGGELGVDVLDDIQALAASAMSAQPPTLNEMMFNQINDRLLNCATNEPPASGSEEELKAKVIAAKNAAQAGDWNQVLQQMNAWQ